MSVKVTGIDPMTRFTLYDKGVYWSLKNDGAAIKCGDCGESFTDFSKILLTQTPNGKRQVICLDCIDEWWHKNAVNLGIFGE